MGRPNIYAHLSDFTQLLWMTCSPLVLPFFSLGSSFFPLPSNFCVAFHSKCEFNQLTRRTVQLSQAALNMFIINPRVKIFSHTINLWGQPMLRSWAQGKGWGSERLLKFCNYCLHIVCRKYSRPPTDCSSTKYFKNSFDKISSEPTALLPISFSRNSFPHRCRGLWFP